MSEFTYKDVRNCLAKAGFAESVRTGAKVRGILRELEGFLVAPDAPDAVLVMHEMDTKERREDSAAIRSMLDKYREVLVEDGLAVELRERELMPLMLIVKRASG